MMIYLLLLYCCSPLGRVLVENISAGVLSRQEMELSFYCGVFSTLSSSDVYVLNVLTER